MSALFRKELEDLLALERRLRDDVLPEMRERARTVHLRATLDRHLLEAEAHVRNLERVLALADPADRELGEDFEILAAVLRTEAVKAASHSFLVHTATALGVDREYVRLLQLNMEQDAFAAEQAEKTLVELLAESVENVRPR